MIPTGELRQHSPVTKAEPEGREGQPLGRQKDELLALLGHELRNPLAAIRNALQVFRLCGDRAATRDWVREVLERQTDLMGGVIEEVLEFSRFSHGKAHFQKSPEDVTQVVALAIETVQPRVKQRGHTLKVNLPPAPVIVEGDRVRLVQMLTNLLGNAAKYTDPGGQIELTAAAEGDDLVFRVRDNGIGIAPDLLPRVFDLLWQAPSTAGRSQGGLGIGLALVRQIVAMHGGSVRATSAGFGKGSEFVVRLPRARYSKDHGDTLCANARPS